MCWAKLNREKKALNDVIALIDDAQERLNTSKKNVEKGCAINGGIQATLWLLRETKGHSCHEIWSYPYSESEDIAGTPWHEKHMLPLKVLIMEPLRQEAQVLETLNPCRTALLDLCLMKTAGWTVWEIINILDRDEDLSGSPTMEIKWPHWSMYVRGQGQPNAHAHSPYTTGECHRTPMLETWQGINGAGTKPHWGHMHNMTHAQWKDSFERSEPNRWYLWSAYANVCTGAKWHSAKAEPSRKVGGANKWSGHSRLSQWFTRTILWDHKNDPNYSHRCWRNGSRKIHPSEGGSKTGSPWDILRWNGPLLSCWDPHLIQNWSPTSPPTLTLTILWDPWHYATIPLTPDQPLRILTWYHLPLRPLTNPWDLWLHFNSYYSVLVLRHTISIFMSPSQSLPFHFWYIAPFQYSCSLVLASALSSQ